MSVCGDPVSETYDTKKIIDASVGERAIETAVVGNLLLDGERVCALTRISSSWAITASHCYKNILWGRYTAQFGTDNLRIYHEPRRYKPLDLVLLPITQKESPDWLDWKHPDPDAFVEFEEFDPLEPINIVVTDSELQTFESEKEDHSYEIQDRFVFHKLNTNIGDSGSPIFQGSSVVGIHLGADKESNRNVAALTGEVSFSSFTFEQELEDVLGRDDIHTPIYIEESCQESSSGSSRSRGSGRGSHSDSPEDRRPDGHRDRDSNSNGDSSSKPEPEPREPAPRPEPEPREADPEPPLRSDPEPRAPDPEPEPRAPDPEPRDPGPGPGDGGGGCDLCVSVPKPIVIALAPESKLKACIAILFTVVKLTTKPILKLTKKMQRSAKTIPGSLEAIKRYPKQFEQYSKLASDKLKKAITSHEKQIRDHKNKIQNPKEHIPNWESLHPNQREHLLTRKWPGDIDRHEAYKKIAQVILQSREKT